MSKIKRREINILYRVCKQHDIPVNLAKTLLKTAKSLSYENQTETARRKQYQDLISFYCDKTED